MRARGLSALCLRARTEGPGAAYGYAGMGPYPGAQAELLRVPWADANCLPVAGEPGDAYEDDFVLLADAFVTGWRAAATLADVRAGDTVAVFGARAVYCVDQVDARLDKAEDLGAVPIDFRQGDPVEQIRGDRARRGLPLGEEKLLGVDKAVDAVGFQAHDRAHPDRERADQVLADAARPVNPGGAIAVASVYPEKDLTPQAGGTPDGHLNAPWGTFFAKGIDSVSGGCLAPSRAGSRVPR
ncbi:hypothetical protein [Micromonospora sp. NPDC093277]|uniref:hypothetical protein n=1 Tax=Micromonospora sp. NPDC093277 TaxID=3364291 RepID=UPI003826BA5B